MATLYEARKELTLRLGPRNEIQSGVYYNNSWQGTPSGTDATRHIVSTSLASTDRTGSSPALSAASSNYEWIWVSEFGEQRRIIANGYNSHVVASSVLTGQDSGADASIVGYHTIDRALPYALPAGTYVEIIGRFPVLDSENLPGIHWAINEALSVMHWPHTIEINGITDASRYDISSDMPWLKDPSQILRVYSPETDSGAGPDVMRGAHYLVPDGEKMWLHIPDPVATGDTFSVQVNRPALTWIKTGGTWASSTAGLVNDYDECLPDVDALATVAYAMIARRMSRTGPKPQRDDWRKEAAEADETAKPFLSVQIAPQTPRRDWHYRTPLHPSGRPWRATQLVRRWPR